MKHQRRKRSARGSGADLRAEILTATRALLAETNSVEAVSIRAIADLVGVSAPSIYRHFVDKNVLIEAVCTEVFEELDVVLREAVTDEQPLPERLRLLGLTYVRFARDHAEQYRISMLQPADSAGAVDLVLGSGAFRRFTATISEGMESGLFTPGDPIPIALELWSAAHGVAALQLCKPFLPWGDLDAMADRALRASLIGYRVLDLFDDDTSTEDILAWLETQRR